MNAYAEPISPNAESANPRVVCNVASNAGIINDKLNYGTPQCVGGGGGGGIHPAIGIERGGSNFNWYDVAGCSGNEPYGVIVNYDTQTTAIRNSLSQMHMAGQLRLRLMIVFQHGYSDRTIMDSTGGHLTAQNMSNLVNLIADIRNAEFGEMEITFGPQGQSSPFNWSSFNQAIADENYALIVSVHEALQNSGIRILYDLGNEAMTSSQSNMRYRYMKYIWPKYNAAYGSLYDSVGFSFASGEISAISNMGAVYGHNSYPVFVDIHIYPYGGNSAGDILYAAAHNLGTIGPQAGQYRWIIGEANFNNATDAASMAAQINSLASTDSKPWYLLQWPIDAASPSCTVPNVAPFNNYETYGF